MPIDEAPIEAIPLDHVHFALTYRFIEFVSTASHVGKSMLSTFVALLLRQLGHKVLLVRIESKAVRSAFADIHIDSEDFAGAARLPGGEVAVLRPLYDALQKAVQDDAKPVVIVDWAGGLSAHRAKIHAATRFDDRLADIGMRGRTMVLTTSLSDRMRQAAELIAQTRTITPALDVALVLNHRVGNFRFVEGSDERQICEEPPEGGQGLSRHQDFPDHRRDLEDLRGRRTVDDRHHRAAAARARPAARRRKRLAGLRVPDAGGGLVAELRARDAAGSGRGE